MLHKLILLLSELEHLSSLCNRCGMCQMHCPVFLETKNESDVARGKLALINGIAAEILKHPEKVLSRLNNCLLCGACSSGCSRNVKTIEIFIKARIIITEYTGLSLIKRLLLKKIVSHPGIFDKSINLIKKFQHLFFKSGNDSHNSIAPRLYMPFFRGRQLQPLAADTFHSQIEKRDKPKQVDQTPKKLNVIFFTGCLIDKIMPEVGLSCIEVLEYHNVNVLTFEQEGCCGIPSLASGDMDSFNKLVEHNSRLLNIGNIDFIVTACATCTYTINKLWPMIYKGERLSEIDAIAGKTTDITQFVVSNFLSGKNKAEKHSEDHQSIVTIHDPCHLKKSLNIQGELRTLVKANRGCLLQEMDNPGTCCGFGGTFNLTNYKLSSKIGEKKCRAIEDSKAEIVATGCPACMLQLKDQLAKNQTTVRVKHVVEVYADSLK